MVETSATSTNPADCKKLTTQQFMEQTDAGKWQRRDQTCEEEAQGRRRRRIRRRLRRRSRWLEGHALTRRSSGGSLDGQEVEVALVKEGDQWKLDEVVEFTKFDQAKLIEILEEGLVRTWL